jgi:hypothetical protein
VIQYITITYPIESSSKSIKHEHSHCIGYNDLYFGNKFVRVTLNDERI